MSVCCLLHIVPYWLLPPKPKAGVPGTEQRLWGCRMPVVGQGGLSVVLLHLWTLELLPE